MWWERAPRPLIRLPVREIDFRLDDIDRATTVLRDLLREGKRIMALRYFIFGCARTVLMAA